MKSRITIVVAALLALATAPAIAQNPQAPPGGGRGQGFAQRRMQMLMNGITLTAAQQAQVDSIQAAYRAKMPPMTPGQMPDSATRAQRSELMNQQDLEIRKVLTKDQQVIFDKNLADMRAMMQRPRPGA